MHEYQNKSIHLTDSSFETLFHTYNAGLKVYALHFVKRQDVAEDIVHDTFIAVWRKRNRIRMDTIKAYLYSSVRNKCLKYLKHLKVRTRYQDDILKNKEVPGSLTWEYYQRAELEEHIGKAMERLSPQQRKIFNMSRQEYKTSAQIGVELGLSSRTVEKHMETALNKMRVELAEYLPIEA